MGKESLLGSIPGVVVYLDDILITGEPTEQEHLDTLGIVLEMLQDVGLKLQKNKCAYLAPSVTYLNLLFSLFAQPIHHTGSLVPAAQRWRAMAVDIRASQSILGVQETTAGNQSVGPF